MPRGGPHSANLNGGAVGVHVNTMPTVRYRLLPFYSERLRFRNGSVLLSCRCDSGGAWVFYAVKEDDPSAEVEIMRRDTMVRWAADRFSGFDLEAGSPADKVMRALVKADGATVMSAGETFHHSRKTLGTYYGR